MQDAASDQLRRMRATAACRFIAAARLRKRDRRSAVLTALASSIVLFLTVIPLMYHVSALVNSGLTALSFITSILIICFSLIQYSNNDSANSEQFNRSGLEINEIYRKFEANLQTAALSDVLEVAEKYNAVLHKYSINHESYDFDWYRLQHRYYYQMGWIESSAIRIRAGVREIAPYLLLMLVIVAFALVIDSDGLAARFTQSLKPFAATAPTNNSN